VHRGTEVRIGRQAGVIHRRVEAGEEALAEIAHVTVPRVHLQQRGLVAARARVQRWATHHLGPVGGQSLDVLRMLAGMRERVVELGVREAPRVVGFSQGEERGLAAGELEERGAHGDRCA
jgi:hypothetical protein